MKLFTYQELETKIRKDTDTQDVDNFIGADEMAGIVNEAIDIAEAEILKIAEDYFLTSAPLTLVQGQANYDLPTDVYAQKIREIIYSNGPKIYEIMRVRDPKKFLEKAIVDYNPSGETYYGYMLKSVTAGAQDKIVLSPPSQEAGAFVEVWYLRNANRIPMVGEVVNAVTTTRAIQLATVIDIPEWYVYITEFAKMRVREKEANQILPVIRENVKSLKDGLVETLTNRVVDNNDTVPQDTSFYQEHN